MLFKILYLRVFAYQCPVTDLAELCITYNKKNGKYSGKLQRFLLDRSN
jgi:hypothetical protein